MSKDKHHNIVRIRQDLFKKFEDIAAKKNISVRKYIQQALEEYYYNENTLHNPDFLNSNIWEVRD